jgi:tRNA(Ile)-lysidine synthetase-like protein
MAPREESMSLEPPVRGGVLVAASGGADSTALALLLSEAKVGPLHLGHVQHGFRPAASAHEVAALRELSRRIAAPLHVVSADLPARWAPGDKIPEALARETRRALLRDLAIRLGLPVVALGHHARDQVETQLLQIERGGGLRALRGMAAVRRRDGLLWWRPLLGHSPDSLRAHLRERGIAWVEDESNADLRLRRNRVRHAWLPQLERDRDPLLARAPLLSRLAATALDRIATSAREGRFAAVPSVRAGALRRRAAPLARLAPALLHEFVRSWSLELLGERAERVLARGRESRELTAWLRSSRGGSRRSGDLVIERTRDWLLLRDASRTGAPERPDREVHPIAAGAEARLRGSAVSVRAGGDAGADSVFVDPGARVTLRARRPGDRVRLAGGRDVALSRLLVEAGSLPGERDWWPVVCIDDAPAWIPGACRAGAAVSRVARPGWRALVACGLPRDEERVRRAAASRR